MDHPNRWRIANVGMLDNKVVAVTGAGGGIGREIERLCAKEGAAAMVNDPGIAQNGDGWDSGPAEDTANDIKAAGGTAEQKAHWLPRLAAGEIASFGLTEAGSGSDSAAMQTMAVRSGNGYILNGTKRYITNAPFANVALIMARTSKEELPKNAHVSAFLVPMDTTGISVGKSDKKMGQAGSHVADIIMEDAHISGDALLGSEEGKGFATAMQSLDNGRLSVGSAAAGYLAEYDAERFFRDSRIYRIYEGTTQILQLQIPKNMLREYAGKL
jgi:acyl-CoA dehydrogenase